MTSPIHSLKSLHLLIFLGNTDVSGNEAHIQHYTTLIMPVDDIAIGAWQDPSFADSFVKEPDVFCSLKSKLNFGEITYSLRSKL